MGSAIRIAVITDAHANLPALRAALAAIRQEGCDALFHTGDAIGIGPFPAECLAMLLDTPDAQFVMGNHDAWLVNGLPESPEGMDAEEIEHHHWTHGQIGADLRVAVAQWPWVLEQEFDGVQATFLHYALAASGQGFAPIIRQPTVADLDRLFAAHRGLLICYGHHHPFADAQGQARRYVNPGSLGCHTTAVARYAVVEFGGGGFAVQHRAAPYDDAALFTAFEQRHMPDRALIYRAFFGSRFGAASGGR